MNSRIPMPLTRHSDDYWYDFHHSPDDKSEVQVRKRGEGGGLATDRPLDWLWLSSKLALYLLPAGPEIYLDPTPKRLTLQDREKKGKKRRGWGEGLTEGLQNSFPLTGRAKSVPHNPWRPSIIRVQMWGQHTLPPGSPWTEVLSASWAPTHKSLIFSELGITAKSCAFY